MKSGTLSVSSVIVETGSRIHLGFIDPPGASGRRWGSIGLYVNEPKLLLRISRWGGIAVNGPGWMEQMVRDVVDKLGLEGLRVECASYIPRHVGLGSGTQTILSLGVAASRLYGLNLSLRELAVKFGRCRVSGAGYWLFQMGGMTIDGGVKASVDVPPLLARVDFPEDWMVLLAVPEEEGQGLHGREEEESLERLAPGDPGELSLTVFMKLLPSVIERDFELFARAAEEVDFMTSRFFEKVQSGRYHVKSGEVVEIMRRTGVRGIGQSSWGPTIYGFLKRSVAGEVRKRVEETGGIEGFKFILTTGRNRGADIRIQ